MNQVSLVGRVTQTPELRDIQDGNLMTKFNVAIDRYLAASQREEKRNEGKVTADFPRIVVWGKQAEICCKYLQKGSLIAISGRVATSSFENQEGKMIYRTEIIAERVQFLHTVRAEDREEGGLFLEEEVVLS